MSYVRRSLALAVVFAAFLALPAGKALAYGAVDQPVAQLEFSGNCDDPAFSFCANVVGVGGIWLWIELDADTSADYAGSNCIHGTASTPLNGTGTWSYSIGVPLGVKPLAIDPSNQYYVVVLTPELAWAFPVTQGHYSWSPEPGVDREVTVAP